MVVFSIVYKIVPPLLEPLQNLMRKADKGGAQQTRSVKRAPNQGWADHPYSLS